MENPPFIDSHFHLVQSVEKNLNSAELLEEAVEAGVMAGMDIGVDLEQIDLRRECCTAHAGFGYTLGLYPSFADRESLEPDLARLETELRVRADDSRLWALGEIGLDFHWNYGSPAKQKKLLRCQLELAREYDLPVVIHNREADGELCDLLISSGARGGIMHCFSSDRAVMKTFLDIGFYVSFAGNLTFRNAETIREAAHEVPLNRVLFETDAPYLSPVPLRGKLNRPSHVIHVYDFFAKLRRMPLAELREQVHENFTRAIPRYAAMSG